MYPLHASPPHLNIASLMSSVMVQVWTLPEAEARVHKRCRVRFNCYVVLQRQGASLPTVSYLVQRDIQIRLKIVATGASHMLRNLQAAGGQGEDGGGQLR